MAKITWAGQACFQISISNSKEHSAQIVIDPFDEKTGLKIPKLEGDILMVTHDHFDHNNVKAVKPLSREAGKAIMITGPGEYEISGVFIKGIPAFHDNSQGKERGKVTIYTIEAEDMRFCHLSDLGQDQLTDEQLEQIGQVDILMVPVGGGGFTIDGQGASKIISQIDPKIVIPMHYNLPGLKIKLDSVDKFKKAVGKNSIEPQDKLQIKSSALPKEGMEIIILKP